MFLLFNMLSWLVITFLPRSNCLLISWLQSPSAVILEPPKIKSATVCTVSPSICYEVMGPDAMILVFWMLSFKPTFSVSSFGYYSYYKVSWWNRSQRRNDSQESYCSSFTLLSVSWTYPHNQEITEYQVPQTLVRRPPSFALWLSWFDNPCGSRVLLVVFPLHMDTYTLISSSLFDQKVCNLLLYLFSESSHGDCNTQKAILLLLFPYSSRMLSVSSGCTLYHTSMKITIAFFWEIAAQTGN